jgi:hypothetical protein
LIGRSQRRVSSNVASSRLSSLEGADRTDWRRADGTENLATAADANSPETPQPS